jgi:uncharacterized MAPEG superfamily protein
MAPVALNVEMKTLGWSVVLLLAQIALQSCSATAEHGVRYNASPRDENLTPKTAFAGRAQRALANLLETYPAFIALALALTLEGRAGGLGAVGAIVWFCARVAYVPVYALGIPYLRSAIWIASVIGLLMMFARLLT